jgi:spore germination protein GerM
LVTTAPTKVGLYYFNQKEDAKLPMAQQINVTSIQPVYRNLPATDNIIRDTIALLLRGDITASDKTSGFISDFPYKDFRLLNATLQNDGTLVLEFTEIPGFTSGGSARMLILSNTIIKTAMQFKGVTKVQFVPDTLFQP